MGGGRNFELPNVERPIFRNLKITGGGQNLERPNVERPNIEITKVELFDFSIFAFILYFYDCLNYSNTQNTYLIIYHQIRNFLNFDSFTNCQIWKICWFLKFNNFRTLIFFEFVNNRNLMIFENLKLLNFFFNLENHNLIPKIGKFWFCSSIWHSALFVISPILIFDLWNSKPHPQKFKIWKIR